MSDGPKHGECGAPKSDVRGVDFHRGTGKWRARIRVDKRDHNLGLFDTHDEAVEARYGAEARLRPPLLDNKAQREQLLEQLRGLYEINGPQAFSSDLLEAQPGALYPKLRSAGLDQKTLLAELGLESEYTEWREANRTYGGKLRPRWTWERVVEVAQAIKEERGELQTQDWFRANSYNSLVSAAFKSGHSFEELRRAVGCFRTSNFVTSRNGKRWRSQPEASLSDFLHARNIPHRKGRRYPASYAVQSERHHGLYDLHFDSPIRHTEISVEVWGSGLNPLTDGNYDRTRKLKEDWHANDPNFLGIEYADCLSDEKLSKILKPLIGEIEPSNFETDTDRSIETTHWSSAPELLQSCREIAAMQPDGIFPGESWLRKRGRYAGRDGETYNTLAVMVNQRLGGVRNVRRLLYQDHASTTSWTPNSVIAAWTDFQKKHGCTPTQARWRLKGDAFITARREASRLWAAAKRHGVLDECKEVGPGRPIKWTRETTAEAWCAFVAKHGRTPSQCMSAYQRARLPPEVYAEATRIYGAANRLALLGQLRGS